MASAIWWIRPTVLQVRVNLSAFPLNFIYSSIMGVVDDARVVLGKRFWDSFLLMLFLKSDTFFGF